MHEGGRMLKFFLMHLIMHFGLWQGRLDQDTSYTQKQPKGIVLQNRFEKN